MTAPTTIAATASRRSMHDGETRPYDHAESTTREPNDDRIIARTEFVHTTEETAQHRGTRDLLWDVLEVKGSLAPRHALGA